MKRFIAAGLMVLTVGLLSACQYDNYEPPKSTLSGRVTYQDQPVGVRTNGVQLEIWQRGYQLFTKIPVFISQDGTFSASLSDGDYKLVRLRGNGPWVDNTDTISVQVRGATQVNVPVQPFFFVKNASFQQSGSTLTGTCKVDPVVAGRTIERVTLYVGRTRFVDATNNAGSADLSGTALADLTKNLSLTYTIPTTLTGNLFARIGVKTSGIPELQYTDVQAVTR